jgi:hypothetical protein
MFESPTDEQNSNQYDYTNEDGKNYYQNRSRNQGSDFLKTFHFENDEEEKEEEEEDDEYGDTHNQNAKLQDLLGNFNGSLKWRKSSVCTLNESIRVFVNFLSCPFFESA